MGSGAPRLEHALKNLRERWDIAREQWADKVALEFEKNHIEPLDSQTVHAARGMDKIAEIIQKVKYECS
jgi:hypothetical protein